MIKMLKGEYPKWLDEVIDEKKIKEYHNKLKKLAKSYIDDLGIDEIYQFLDSEGIINALNSKEVKKE